MTGGRWHRITDLFHVALARDPGRRGAFVREAAGTDSGLKDEVESLIAAHQDAGSFGSGPIGLSGTLLGPDAWLGPYRVDRLLGAGGMGEVYRAHDPRLKRAVAIKVLPAHVPADTTRLARFEREACVLASLNHPHIATLYGVEEFEGGRALVMELVEGEDLADRITRGPIPPGEALLIARQIAEALEAAHEQGIIHRDLKPANIKIRDDGTIKVLDFGLAKLAERIDGEPAARTRNEDSPGDAYLRTAPLPGTRDETRDGAILGTAAYMSPEQARGRGVDKRTDIWSFGCVLYEMLTGSSPFAGATLSETLSAIEQRDPDAGALPERTPAPIRTLLRRCLEKDRKRRLDSAAAVRLEIDDVLAGRADAGSASRAPAAVSPPLLAATLLGCALLTAIIASLVLRQKAQAPPLRSRFAIVPAAVQPLNVSGQDRDLALSPDGRYLVYRFAGTNTTGSPLMVRAIDQLQPQPLAGIEFAFAPFFSPDSHWIGFFEAAALKKVAVSGGPVVTLGTITGSSLGATWGDDGTVVFGTDDPATGLWRTSADGGPARVLTSPDVAQLEGDHGFPSMLPGSRGVLFTIIAPGQPDHAQVAVLDLKTGHRKTLLRGSQAEYVAPSGGGPGLLIFVQSGVLRAVPFDPVTLALRGEPITADERVMMKPSGAANYAVSPQGMLVYVPHGTGAETNRPRNLVWVDRSGREEPIKAPLRPYGIPRLSPDGRRLAVDVADVNVDIWIWDLAAEQFSRLTFDRAIDSMAVWAPDARWITFMSKRSGVLNLYRQAADGSGDADRLTTSAAPQWPTSMAPDGRRLAGFDLAGTFVLSLPTGARRPPGPVPPDTLPSAAASIESRFEGDFAEISPNGRYVAYQAKEGGQNQVFVRPFPRVDAGRWQVSAAGASRPAWARSGRELFYLDQSKAMISVPVSTDGPTFSAGTPVRLFDSRYAQPNPSRHYDVSADARRFVMLKDRPGDTDSAGAGSIIVVGQWSGDVQRMVTGAR